jgi:hypothetical protein
MNEIKQLPYDRELRRAVWKSMSAGARLRYLGREVRATASPGQMLVYRRILLIIIIFVFAAFVDGLFWLYEMIQKFVAF